LKTEPASPQAETGAGSKKPRKIQELLRELDADSESGLTEAQVEVGLEKYGKNQIVPQKKQIRWGIFAFLKEPMIWLVAAAVVYFLLGETLDGFVMLLAVVPIAVLDMVIEVKTDKALEKLEKLGQPEVTVVRNGKEDRIKAEELVPGDILLLQEGSVVMADCAIISASDVAVDES
jgi:Ca2+-transporting ATPase